MTQPAIQSWLKVTPKGLYCEPGRCLHRPPPGAVERAIVTHGHADHARPGHRAVLATAETGAIMRHRLGEGAPAAIQTLAYGAPLRLGSASVTLIPAGHILGSAQVVLEHEGSARHRLRRLQTPG